MWTTVFVLVAVAVAISESRTINSKDGSVRRVKRWGDYDCPPYPHYRHHYYPPPPHWHQQMTKGNYYQENLPAATQGVETSKPASESHAVPERKQDAASESHAVPERKQDAGAADNKSLAALSPLEPSSSGEKDIRAAQKPCENCNSRGKTAISNAESDTGNAIAVAISRN